MVHKFISPTPIGDRMKPREKAHDVFVKSWEYMVMRFDGHCFSTFTRGFQKPFDDVLTDAMQQTMCDCVDKFTATLGYFQSDEITLVFTPLCTEKEYQDAPDDKVPVRSFNGRKDKIITLIASYISVRFNFHIMNGVNANKDKYTDQFVEKINRCEQFFDGRLLIFGNDESIELLNYFVWRINDCYRNTTSSFARHMIKDKHKLHKKGTNEVIPMMNEIDGFDYYKDVDERLQLGVLAKKELYELKCVDMKTGKEIMATRSRIATKVIDILAQSEYQYLIDNKYW
jgi:tRNA(His) guanylyltransferase